MHSVIRIYPAWLAFRVIDISIYVYLCKQEKTTYFFGTVIFWNNDKKVTVSQRLFHQ